MGRGKKKRSEKQRTRQGETLRSQLVVLTNRHFDYISGEIGYHNLKNYPFSVRHSSFLLPPVIVDLNRRSERPTPFVEKLPAIVSPTTLPKNSSSEQDRTLKKTELAEDLVDNHFRPYFQRLFNSESGQRPARIAEMIASFQIQRPKEVDGGSTPEIEPREAEYELRRKVERIRQILNNNFFMAAIFAFFAELKELSELTESINQTTPGQDEIEQGELPKPESD
jgi:hypothetical protein